MRGGIFDLLVHAGSTIDKTEAENSERGPSRSSARSPGARKLTAKPRRALSGKAAGICEGGKFPCRGPMVTDLAGCTALASECRPFIV